MSVTEHICEPFLREQEKVPRLSIRDCAGTSNLHNRVPRGLNTCDSKGSLWAFGVSSRFWYFAQFVIMSSTRTPTAQCAAISRFPHLSFLSFFIFENPTQSLDCQSNILVILPYLHFLYRKIIELRSRRGAYFFLWKQQIPHNGDWLGV